MTKERVGAPMNTFPKASKDPSRKADTMDCAAVYNELDEAGKRIQATSGTVRTTQLATLETPWIEVRSLLIWGKVRNTIKPLRGLSGCYKIDRIECQQCLSRIQDKLCDLLEEFREVYREIEKVDRLIPLSKWAIGRCISELEEQAETLELATDSELRSGLQAFMADLQKAPPKNSPSWREELKTL
ncbi:MAG: hypothetical protein SWQ30_06620 [Thermodesulfobacteriota bacterium]|nr:hypothetical protein [Thermodesulfobacteriota bacterium]